MNPLRIVYIIAAAVMLLLAWTAFYQHNERLIAERTLVTYKGMTAQAAQDQLKQNAKDALAAADKLKAAEVQRAKDKVDNQHIVDSLTDRLRRLSAALNSGRVPGPVANPGGVQGGPPSTPEAGGVQPATGGFVDAARTAVQACLDTYADWRAIIATEPAK